MVLPVFEGSNTALTCGGRSPDGDAPPASYRGHLGREASVRFSALLAGPRALPKPGGVGYDHPSPIRPLQAKSALTAIQRSDVPGHISLSRGKSVQNQG